MAATQGRRTDARQVSAQPDLERLGRVLSVAPGRLAGLGALSARDLDALTCQVSDALPAEDAERLRPLLALIDRIPAPLAAGVRQARIAAAIDRAPRAAPWRRSRPA